LTTIPEAATAKCRGQAIKTDVSGLRDCNTLRLSWWV
jgi:hypothetical protein